jgi:hypothetical protein
MDDCTKETPAGGGRTREVNDRELRRREEGTMGPERVDTLVSRCKRHSSRTEPKGHEVFYRREVFRSGEGIFLVDRNPIWMTEPWPRLAVRLLLCHVQQQVGDEGRQARAQPMPRV